jgi:hypothetical protein
MPPRGIYGPIEHSYCEPFAEAFAGSMDFRDWLFRRLSLPDWVGRSKSLKSEQAVRGARYWWKNYFCSERRCVCAGAAGREIDILLFALRDDGKALGVHVECKQPKDTFHPGQAEGYPIRKVCWSTKKGGPKTLLPHDQAVVVLICDRLAKHSPEDLRHFEDVIYFDEIAKLIVPYPAAV